MKLGSGQCKTTLDNHTVQMQPYFQWNSIDGWTGQRKRQTERQKLDNEKERKKDRKKESKRERKKEGMKGWKDGRHLESWSILCTCTIS